MTLVTRHGGRVADANQEGHTYGSASFLTGVDDVGDWYAPSFRSSLDEELAMNEMISKVQRFLTSEDGPTAVEYAVMLALIIIVCLGAIQAVGTNANAKFNTVQNALT